MTVTTNDFRYEGAIAQRYNDCALKMAEDVSTTLDWNAYPLQVTEVQFKAIPCVKNVFNILAGTLPSPLTLSGAQIADSLIIAKINDIFKGIMEEYKNEFDEACELDRACITQLDAYPQSYFGWLGTYLLRTVNGHCQTVQRDGSANRYAWMIATGTREKLRMEALRDDVELRSEELVDSIQEELDLGFHHLTMIRELDALERLYKAVFPRSTLIIKGMNIREYVDPLLQALSELK